MRTPTLHRRSSRPGRPFPRVGALVRHAAVVWRTGRGDFLAWHGHDRRGIVYTALAGSTGTLLVVVSVGLGIYLSAPGERMRRLRRHAGWRATRLWLVVVNLLVTLAVSLIALATDTSAT